MNASREQWRGHKLASPKATGDSGGLFESRVAAYYLSALLTGGTIRGLGNAVAKEVRLQRAYEGQPLDDVIVQGMFPTGPATLSLQAKRQLTFGSNNLFKKVLNQCWDTFNAPGFRHGRDQFGVALAVYSANVDDHYQTVLSWARYSASAQDFFTRVNQPGLNSRSARDFLKTMRNVSIEVSGSSPPDDDALWSFLKHFVILHFDFELQGNSRDYHHVLDRIAFALCPEEREESGKLWQALVDESDNAKPAAGSIDQAALRSKLGTEFHFEILPSCLADLDRIVEESQRALADITASLGGLVLNRDDRVQEIDQALGDPQFIEVVGDPGAGKSAILRMLAERQGMKGPVLFLKHDRLADGPGWAGQARLWGLENNLARLLSELASVGEPILFIDGIDRIQNHAQWTVINDLLRALFKEGNPQKWRIIVSARGNSLDYIQRLDQQVLNRLKRQRVTVPQLTEHELDIVARAHLALAPLLQRSDRTKELAKSPYLLGRLIRWLGTRSTESETPATAIDLMKLWWSPADEHDNALVGQRQDLLLALAEKRLHTPGRPVLARELNLTAALESLVSDETLQLDSFRRTVTFSHDILDDWTLGILLEQRRHELPNLLRELREPLWLVDAVQLMATLLLEENGDPSQWLSFLRRIEAANLQPRWRRAILTAPLQSTRAIELLTRLESVFLAEEARLLQDLLVAVRTVETFPNTNVLDPKILPDFSDNDLVEIAHRLAFPRGESWTPLLDWLVPKLQTLPPQLVWDLSLTMELWQRGLANHRTRFARPFILFSLEWLHLLEQGYFNRSENVAQRVGALDLDLDDERKLEERLRTIVISSPNDAPDLVAAYLKEVGSQNEHHRARKEILENTEALARFVPKELVDFMLEVMREFPKEDDPREFHQRRSRAFIDEFGINESDAYYPPSHLQGPFLTLLRFHTDEGLRLINGLCNHAIDTWRLLSELQNRFTPLPVHLQFPWGEKEFWGHAREYLWYRGLGTGPYPVIAALMALEVWVEERVVAGDSIEVLFQKVLQENNCVSVMGVCVSVALAYPSKSLKAALPLVTCPFLWLWDIQRLVQDSRGMRSNEIADWTRYRHLLQAVRDRNNLPHRKYEIRSLAPLYIFAEDKELRNVFIETVKTFPDNLPFECVEQRNHEESVQELKGRMENFASMADPANWRQQPAPEGGGIILTFNPPINLTAKDQKSVGVHEEIMRDMQLALWAEKAFDEGTIPNNLTITEALKEARKLDEANLFAYAQDPETFETAPGAVSGVAAVIVRFSENLDADLVEWCRDVFHRAVLTPEKDDPLLVRTSLLTFHPRKNAARGLAALLAREQATNDDRKLLLTLLGHPLEEVMATTMSEVWRSWAIDQRFCWQVLVMGMRLTATPHQILSHYERTAYSEAESEWIAGIISQTWDEYMAEKRGDLPFVPMPWVPAPEGEGRDGYMRSDVIFRWDLAPKVLFPLPLEQIMSDEASRIPFLGLVGNLVQWTIQASSPPWTNRRHDTEVPVTWTIHFFEWCGGLSRFLILDDIRKLVLAPVWSTEKELGLRCTAPFMYGVIKNRFPQHQLASDATLELWSELCEWVLSHRKWERVKDQDFLGQEFGECVELALFTHYRVALLDAPCPELYRVKNLVERWAEKFGSHPAAFSKLIVFLNHTAWEWCPEPAFTWLESILDKAKENPDFWNRNDNGGKAAKFLHRVWAEKAEEITKVPASFDRLSRMADLLMEHGERLAAQIQQGLAAHKRRGE